MKSVSLSVALCCSGLFLYADTPQERLRDATEVLSEAMSTPDKGIPHDLIDKAHCVVIVPGLKKGAFVVGGEYGKGFAVCRNPNGTGWGAPAAVRVEGGSIGFQIGGSSTDVVMLVMSDRGMRRLLEDKFTLGAGAAVAAGPVGRAATAQTDAQLTADILSWSRTKGVFAGISLQGATLRNDLDANQELYGQRISNNQILLTNRKPPDVAQPLVAQLNHYSGREARNTPAETRGKQAVSGEANRANPDKNKQK